VDHLDTGNTAALDEGASGLLSPNTLTLTITSQRYLNRQLTSIMFSPNFTSSCDYGVSNPYWSHDQTTVPCNDIWTAQLPWSFAASSCGLTRTDSFDSVFVVFTGTITVTMEDTLGPLHNQSISRMVVTIVNFEVAFPKTILIDADSLTIYSTDADLLASITSQQFSSPTLSGRMRLFTTLQYPYQLTSPTMSGHPPNTDAQVQLVAIAVLYLARPLHRIL